MSFDLDAAIAEAESEDGVREPWTFTFDAAEYTLPPEMDVRSVAAISNGRLDDGLRLLLGDEQWTKLQSSPKLLSSKTLKRLFDAYAAYTDGSDVGESSGSTVSSASTAEPSNPISPASTPEPDSGTSAPGV